MNNNGFELLLVRDKGEYWQVIGITYSDALAVEPDCSALRASLYTIEACKKALAENKLVTISKKTEHSEVLPHELVIEAPTELDNYKQIAINEVLARMHQTIFAINVIDLMDYLDCYINLLNAGYFITDANREDKYFEVIQDSQECEEPAPLSPDATFEDEQKYIEMKQKYAGRDVGILLYYRVWSAFNLRRRTCLQALELLRRDSSCSVRGCGVRGQTQLWCLPRLAGTPCVPRQRRTGPWSRHRGCQCR